MEWKMNLVFYSFFFHSVSLSDGVFLGPSASRDVAITLFGPCESWLQGWCSSWGLGFYWCWTAMVLLLFLLLCLSGVEFLHTAPLISLYMSCRVSGNINFTLKISFNSELFRFSLFFIKSDSRAFSWILFSPKDKWQRSLKSLWVFFP